jgi:hypothetical protein
MMLLGVCLQCPSASDIAPKSRKRRKGLMMWYALGGMILASVGFGLYKLLAGSKKQKWGEPQSFLLRR